MPRKDLLNVITKFHYFNMARQPKIDRHKKEFILANAGKMRQYKIAESINVSPGLVSRVISGQLHGDIITEYTGQFNIDDFAKYYQY